MEKVKIHSKNYSFFTKGLRAIHHSKMAESKGKCAENLGLNLWAEGISYSIFTINQIGTSSVKVASIMIWSSCIHKFYETI